MWRFTRKREEHHCLNAVVGSVTWEQIVVKEMIVKGGMAHWGISSCASEKMPDGSQIC